MLRNLTHVLIKSKIKWPISKLRFCSNRKAGLKAFGGMSYLLELTFYINITRKTVKVFLKALWTLKQIKRSLILFYWLH